MEPSRQVRFYHEGAPLHKTDHAVRDEAKEGGLRGDCQKQSWPALKSILQAPTLAHDSPALTTAESSSWSRHALHNLAPPLSPGVKLLNTIAAKERLQANFEKYLIQNATVGNEGAASLTTQNSFPPYFPSGKPWIGPFERQVQGPMKRGDGSQTLSEVSSVKQGRADTSEGHSFVGGIHSHQTTSPNSPAGFGTYDTQCFTPVGGSNYMGQYNNGHINQTASGWDPKGPSRTPHFTFPRNRDSWHTSPNYKGNPCLPGNQSADIPEQESCSLWITNLNLSREHPEHELLAHIKGCGKVYACVVNPPEQNDGHTTSAAKVVFFHVSGAQELLRQARAGEFVINGYVPKVVPNRIRTKSRDPGPECRVIHIEGPKALVDECFLTLWFGNRFVFQTDKVVTLSEDGVGPNGRRRLEWRFASYRCQASAAVQFIEKERRRGLGGLVQHSNLWRHVNIFYAVDPCA